MKCPNCGSRNTEHYMQRQHDLICNVCDQTFMDIESPSYKSEPVAELLGFPDPYVNRRDIFPHVSTPLQGAVLLDLTNGENFRCQVHVIPHSVRNPNPKKVLVQGKFRLFDVGIVLPNKRVEHASEKV